MRRRQNKEINVYSTSAIDLFASGMGAFILLMVAVLPSFSNTSKSKSDLDSKMVDDMITEINNLTQVNSQFLKALTAQMKNLGKVETKVRQLASLQKSARSKVEGLQNVAETMQSTQSIIKDLTQSIRVVNEQQVETQKKLRRKVKEVEKQKTLISLLKKKKDKDEEKKRENEPFVATILRWETLNHDLDLLIVDPNGKEQSFKVGSEQVYSDARSGPGGEIWFYKNPIPGTYQVKVHFHGSYGNNAPALATVSLIDKKKVTVLPVSLIKNETETASVTQFTVDKEGAISISNPAPEQDKPLRAPAQKTTQNSSQSL